MKNTVFGGEKVREEDEEWEDEESEEDMEEEW